MSKGADTKKVKLVDIKTKLLKPALTSHYICNFDIPGAVGGFIGSRVDISPTVLYDRLSLACCDASLPGSSLATVEIDNDYHGVSEKHAYRRLYDDRSDFTFYVNGGESVRKDEYYPIRLFESWIGYCVNEQYAKIENKEYSYRVNYSDLYTTDNLSITKFERDYLGRELQYNFINAFPISINSIPISYESSQILKCTVSFTYSRYWISNLVPPSSPSPTPIGVPQTTPVNPNPPVNPSNPPPGAIELPVIQ